MTSLRRSVGGMLEFMETGRLGDVMRLSASIKHGRIGIETHCICEKIWGVENPNSVRARLLDAPLEEPGL